jgi:hypothetical protein
MKVDQLRPKPDQQVRFEWRYHASVPEQPGCYALVTYQGEVLYVGLASGSIRSRMGNHLDTPEKRKGSEGIVPYWFYFFVVEDGKVEPVERGWMNQAFLEDGHFPPLNGVYSPCT